MITITEDRIGMLAPNAAAAANGKKISRSGGFVSLNQDREKTVIWGECKGSGKSNYKTSVDFLNPDQPVFRCSCPSRQFPCKHALGLMYDYLAGKAFEEAEVEASIQEKREKAQDRAKKKEEKEEKEKSGRTAGRQKTNQAAAVKKMKKQIEGLEKTGQIVEDILSKGISAMAGNTVRPYEDLAKQLGDYYLPGPQILLRRLLIDIRELKKAGADEKTLYEDAVNLLEKLSYLSVRAAAFLEKKIQSEDVRAEDSAFYENIGYVWKLDQLRELSLYKENARLLQLSFCPEYDEARAEYIDTGYVMDLDSHEISCTKNYRPVKAVKYVKEDDTVFDVIEVSALYFYPGEGNRRVRFEEFTTRPVTKKDLADVQSGADPDLAHAVKAAKNTLKNVLSGRRTAACIAYSAITEEAGEKGSVYKLIDRTGAEILLSDGRELYSGSVPPPEGGRMSPCAMLGFLGDPGLLRNQALFGIFEYDPAAESIRLIPCSIITPDQVIRLAY